MNSSCHGTWFILSFFIRLALSCSTWCRWRVERSQRYKRRTYIYINLYKMIWLTSIQLCHPDIWQCVKTLYPFCSHQNSWDLWMFIPLKMVLIGIDLYPYLVMSSGNTAPCFTKLNPSGESFAGLGIDPGRISTNQRNHQIHQEVILEVTRKIPTAT